MIVPALVLGVVAASESTGTLDDFAFFCDMKSFPHPTDKNCSVLFGYDHKCFIDILDASKFLTPISAETVCGPTAEVITAGNRAVIGSTSQTNILTLQSDNSDQCIGPVRSPSATDFCYDRNSDDFNPQNLIVGVGKNSDGKATICYALRNVGDDLVARDVYCEDSQPVKQFIYPSKVVAGSYLMPPLVTISDTLALTINFGDYETGFTAINNAVDVYAEKRVIAEIEKNMEDGQYELCVQSYTHDTTTNSVSFSDSTCEPLADKLDCNYRKEYGSGSPTGDQYPGYEAPDEDTCKTGYAVKFSADKTHILVGLIPTGISDRVNPSDAFVLFQRFKVTFNTAENTAMDEGDGDGESPNYSAEESDDETNVYQPMPESSLSDTDIPFSKRPPGRRRRDSFKILLASANTDKEAAQILVAHGETAKPILFEEVRQTPDGAISAFIQTDGNGGNELAFKRIGSDTTCTFKSNPDGGAQKLGPLLQHGNSYVNLYNSNNKIEVINLSRGDALVDADNNVCTFPVSSSSKPVYFSRPEPKLK